RSFDLSHLPFGNGEPESGSLSKSAFDSYLPLMLVDNCLADCQAQTTAAFQARVREFDLLELIEDQIFLVGRNATSLIRHRQLHRTVTLLQRYFDFRASWCKLAGVGKKIDQNLDQPRSITQASNVGGGSLDLDFACSTDSAHGISRSFDHALQRG